MISCCQEEKKIAIIIEYTKPRYLMLKTKCFSNRVQGLDVISGVVWSRKGLDDLFTLYAAQNGENKRHINQFRRRYVEDNTKQEVKWTLYNVFEVPIPQIVTTEERCSTKRKIDSTELLKVNYKRKNIIFPVGNKT